MRGVFEMLQELHKLKLQPVLLRHVGPVLGRITNKSRDKIYCAHNCFYATLCLRVRLG